jgi:polyisoprenoid-binding protein YceI
LKLLAQMRFCLLFLIAALLTVSAGAERPIDIEHSTIRVHVGKAGLFSAAGHEHWVTAPIAEGSLDDGQPSHIWFRVAAGKLTVEPDKAVSASDQAQVQRDMQTKVLDSEQFPDIRFNSTSIQPSGDGTWVVRGDLTVHGQTRPVSTNVRKQQDAYVGHCQIKQTDFGIHPIKVGGGMVKVKDELDIEFSIVPSK